MCRSCSFSNSNSQLAPVTGLTGQRFKTQTLGGDLRKRKRKELRFGKESKLAKRAAAVPTIFTKSSLVANQPPVGRAELCDE